MAILFMLLILLPIINLWLIVIHFRLKKKFDNLIDYLGTQTNVLSNIDEEFWED